MSLSGLTGRLARLEAALGHRDEVPGLIVFIGVDGVPRTGDGVEIDLDATPPGVVGVILRRAEPAPPRLVAADPPSPHDDK